MMYQHQKIPDVVIIGSGVIGCAVAYYAAKAGLRVMAIDSHKVGGQASHVAAGLIAPSPQLTNPTPFATIALASVALFPALHQELLEATGIDFELRASGTLRIATTEDQAAHQQKRLPKQQQLGLELRWLAPDEVHALEPAITPNIYGAVYGPNECQVTTAKLLAAYIKGAENLGVSFVRATACGLRTQQSRVLGIHTRDGRIRAGHVVIAGGAWTPLAGAWLHTTIPISPERGQIATARHLSPRLHHIVFGEQIYLAPKGHDGVIVGAVKNTPGYNQQATIAGLLELFAKGVTVAPSLAEATPGPAVAGLRPRTPDGCPIIGPIPGWEGVSIAAGHHSNGLLLSGITGQIIAAQLTDSQEPLDTTPFRSERFLGAKP
jgi:glycine oxidase